MRIETRSLIEINTDPQRRCYNGVHAKSEMVWTPWEFIEVDVPASNVEKRLIFWRELNDYAISQRGESARREYRAVCEEPTSPAPTAVMNS